MILPSTGCFATFDQHDDGLIHLVADDLTNQRTLTLGFISGLSLGHFSSRLLSQQRTHARDVAANLTDLAVVGEAAEWPSAYADRTGPSGLSSSVASSTAFFCTKVRLLFMSIP